MRSAACLGCQAPSKHQHIPSLSALTSCPFPFQAHHDVCPKFPLTCDGCGKKKISREKVSGFCCL